MGPGTHFLRYDILMFSVFLPVKYRLTVYFTDFKDSLRACISDTLAQSILTVNIKEFYQ